MSDNATSLQTFFGAVATEEWKERAASLAGNPTFAALAGKVAGRTELMSWPATFGEIAGKVPDLLDIDLSEIFVGGWKTSAKIRAYADPKKYAPDETILVELASHVVRSSHKPKLEIVVNDAVIDTVDFELSLSISIDAAVLTIRNAQIHAISLGSCTASGELKLEGHSLAKRESEPFKLPGKLQLERPITISVAGR